MEIYEIQEKLEKGLDGAKVSLEDTSGGHSSDGYHLRATVTYSGFKGLALIEQHRMVKDVLKDEIGDVIHAFSVKTIIS